MHAEENSIFLTNVRKSTLLQTNLIYFGIFASVNLTLELKALGMKDLNLILINIVKE